MRFGLDVAQQRMPWDEVVSRVQFAEDLGFDGAWGFDHFQPMYGDGPGEAFDGMTTLAALAGLTSRLRLGLLVTGVTYRHPSVPAAEAGRDPASIMRASSLSLDDLDTARKHASRWQESGCGYLVCGWPEAGRSQIEAFARDVMPEFTN